MKFRTDVSIPSSETKLEITDRIFSLGSCFATEISALLQRGQLQTFNNPFGTLFNPAALNTAVKRIHDAEFYDESELIKFNDEIISLDHHTSFTTRFAHQTLDRINRNIEAANTFLKETKWIIITYGTSMIYEFLPKQKLVANCHKIPAKYFKKRQLTHLEITDAIYETIVNLRDIANADVQILFTVSPVRHTKEGMAENSLSKAKLITALHEVLPTFENCHYLPAYEIMMDDLRDYRFYKEDMIHPSAQAVLYIWEKFGSAWFSEATMDFIEENFRINRSLMHKPADEQDPKHQDFIQKLEQRIAAQQSKVKHKIFS